MNPITASSTDNFVRNLYMSGYEAGMEAAIAKVKYWRECHKSRLRADPNNSYIQTEIDDCTSLAHALEDDLKRKLCKP